MHFEQLIIVVVGLVTAAWLAGCTMSVTFSPLDEINNRQSWSDSQKAKGAR